MFLNSKPTVPGSNKLLSKIPNIPALRPSLDLTEEPRTAISPGTTPRRVTKCIAMRTDMDNTDMPEAQRGAGG